MYKEKNVDYMISKGLTSSLGVWQGQKNFFFKLRRNTERMEITDQ